MSACIVVANSLQMPPKWFEYNKGMDFSAAIPGSRPPSSGLLGLPQLRNWKVTFRRCFVTTSGGLPFLGPLRPRTHKGPASSA